MHPRSMHWHMLDYVFVRQADHSDVFVTQAMQGTSCWSDHLLDRSKLKLQIAPQLRAQHIALLKKLNTVDLADDDLQGQLEHTLGSIPQTG